MATKDILNLAAQDTSALAVDDADVGVAFFDRGGDGAFQLIAGFFGEHTVEVDFGVVTAQHGLQPQLYGGRVE